MHANPGPMIHPRPQAASIELAGVTLEGDLGLVQGSSGLVVFAHGSGSSRRSPRNRYVAATLQQAGLSTLLFDLLTSEEELVDQTTAQLRFDIALLAQRLVGVLVWAHAHPDASRLRIGCFGASTGAAAALAAAARRPDLVAAVVSRGGRPDLAGAALTQVEAPTLLIVGGHDHSVLEVNRQAMAQMRTHVALEIVPGATHLFEEAGALEQVAALAARWFTTYLRHPP